MGKVERLNTFRDNWVQTRDGLKNLISGLGTSSDKSVSTQYHVCQLSDAQLLAAYRSDWIARKAVDIPAQDAVREWRMWQAEDDQIDAVMKEERRLGLRQKVQAALIRARLFGGGVILIGIEKDDPSTELDPEKIKKDGLKYLHVLARTEITANEIETDPLSEFYGEPKMYQLQNENKGQVEIHPSRVVRMVGNPMPTLDSSRERIWGDSILQSIDEAVKQAGTAAQSLVALIQEAKTDIVKIPGLMDNVSTAEYENALLERFSIAGTARSVVNTYILDAEEEWQRSQTNFSSLPDAVKLYLQIVSGAADIPATRMIGSSPQGMNATGDSDTRNYYDKVSVEQENILRPALARLDECLIRSALGDRPEEMFYEWVPLWQLDEVQRADVSLKKAQTLQIHQNTGLLDPHALSEGLINQIVADGIYPGLSISIEDNDGAPALNEDPAALAAMHGMKTGLALGNPGAAANLQNPKMKANQMAAAGKGAAQPTAAKKPRARKDAAAIKGRMIVNPDGTTEFQACGTDCDCEECRKRATPFGVGDYNECHNPPGPAGGQFCNETGASSLEGVGVHPDEARKVAEDAVKELGIDPSIITIDEGEPPKFEVGGQTYTYGGAADLENGTMKLYSRAIVPSFLKGVAHHEAMHLRFEKVLDEYHKEFDKVMELAQSQPSRDIMHPDGTLKAPYDGQFHRYQKFTELYSNKSTEIHKEDGVSNYSKAYWEDWKAGKVETKSAMHETMAEMYRLKKTYNKTYGGPNLRKLFKYVRGYTA